MDDAERLGISHDIDPKEITLGDKPRRKRKSARKKQPIPDFVKPWADVAAQRKAKRPTSPGILLDLNEKGGGVSFGSPYDDEEAWVNMLGDAFGTRSWGVMRTFIIHLQSLCGQRYKHDAETWVPSERELNAMLAIVHSARPRDELEAMQVAQAVSVHWMQMNVASYALRNQGSWIDPRTAATASMLARTFSLQLACIREGRRRKSSKTKQVIEVHHHQHQHVHLEGVSGDIGGQVHAARGIGHESTRTIEAEAGSTVPSKDEDRRVVSLAGRKGKAGV